MTDLVPSDQIEQIVGVRRHAYLHYALADSTTGVVSILHSRHCKDHELDLRHCVFSLALDNGLDPQDWDDVMDTPVIVRVWEVTNHQRLILRPVGVAAERFMLPVRERLL